MRALREGQPKAWPRTIDAVMAVRAPRFKEHDFECRYCGEQVHIADPSDKRTVYCSAQCEKQYWRTRDQEAAQPDRALRMASGVAREGRSMRDSEGIGIALNQLAREQMKLKLLADISVDLVVCELEGIDPAVYTQDIRAMLAEIGTRLDAIGGRADAVS